MGVLHVAFESRGNVVARLDSSALLFARARPLVPEALDSIELTARAVDEIREGPIGALVVVPGDAGLSDNALLDRQRAFLRSFVRPDVFVVMASLGDSAQAIAMRAVVRLFMIGRRTMHMASSIEGAALWLGDRIGRDPRELERHARDVLARAQRSGR